MAENQKRLETLKPNVLYFGPLGRQGGIGGTARLRNMLGVLEKLGAHTQLISYLPEERFKVVRKQVNDYLNTIAICVSSTAPQIFKIPALLLILVYGLKYIRKTDIIFAHSPDIVYGLPALILAKTFNKPLLIDFMDIKDSITPGFIYRWILQYSSIVFTISPLLEEVKKMGCRNVVYAPGFIDANVFQSNPSEGIKIRKELNISSNEVAIGYVGAFSAEDGLSFLLRAYDRLSRQYGNIKLVMLGGRNVSGSDDIPELIDKLGLAGRVTIIPPQPYELMPAYLSALDIACSTKVDCPANRVADPIRVYEYMSVGLPVVATAVGETLNVIEDGCDGFLAKPGDEDDLARVLEHVIKNLASLQELRRKAREKVIDNYTQEVILKKLEAQLKSLLTKKI